MFNKIKDNLIALILILLCIETVYAGSWGRDAFGYYYLDDFGNRVVKQWRWIDSDNNGIAECFRFDENGYLVTNKTVQGKNINSSGQWYDDQGIVYVYYQTKKRFYVNESNDLIVEKPEIINISTRSQATPSYINPKNVIDSTNKKLIKGEVKDNSINLVGPKGQAPKKASDSAPSLRIISKGTDLLKKMKTTVPTAKYENKGTIDTIAIEEEREIAAMGGLQPGKKLSNFVNVSTKFTKEVASTKIFGGSTWKDCMLLSGNEAYVKFDVKGYNYLIVEVAEQSHVVSDDNETYTYLEVFEDGESIGTYDGFNDSDPETIEIYFDETETKTIAFKLFVSGTYTTRKVYMRNGRLRRLKDDMEPEHNAIKTEVNEYGVLVRSTGTNPANIPTTAPTEATTKKPVTNVIKKKNEGEESTTETLVSANDEPTEEVAETNEDGETKAKIETRERRRNQTTQSSNE